MNYDKYKFTRETDWNLFKVFYEIAEAGGVTRAADLLGRKQPTLSIALRHLEEKLDSKLCCRGPSGFKLSDEGRLALAHCRKLHALVSQLYDQLANVDALRDEVHGRLRLQLISNLANDRLDSLLSNFIKRFPNVELQIEIAPWETIGRALLHGEVDIGIAPARFEHAELAYDFFFRELHGPYCGRGHALFAKKIKDPSALASERFILTGADEPDQLTRFRLKYGIGARTMAITPHLEEARRLVLLGLGLCFLPCKFAEADVERGALWPLLSEEALPSMEIFAISHTKTPKFLARDLFLDFVKALPTESRIDRTL